MTTTSEQNFLAGRDLAVKMLQARDAAVNPHADPEVWWSLAADCRDGHPQDNWALAFVRELLARPELAVGFAAVMSDALVDASPVLGWYQELSFAEMHGVASPA